jgi:fructokinase
MGDILVFGEVLWDVFPDEKHIGGAPFNFAVRCAKQGVNSYLVTAVGKDELGKDALKEIEKHSVRLDFVGESNLPTGACLVTLDEKGSPSYNLLSSVAYDDIKADVGGKFDALYFGTLAQRSENNKKTLEKIMANCEFSFIFCDVNLRKPNYDEESVKTCVENATILKFSEEEALELQSVLYGENVMGIKPFIKKLTSDFPNIKMVIATMGDKGSLVYKTDSGEEFFAPIIPVKVVSTVGAGDNYSATFLTEYLRGKEITECMKKASEVSAKIVSQKGAL